MISFFLTNWPITNITMTSKRARGCYARELSLVASCQTSCQNVGNLSTLVRHYATLPNPTEHVELFRQYPTMTNKHQLLAHTDPTVGVCWRLLENVGVCQGSVQAALEGEFSGKA